ncbi:MAG: maleate cis-trans isomerase family protein [Micromonosporaceae bacterium]
MTTVGFLYPGHAAEDDYPLAEQILGGDIRLVVEHTYGTDLHAVAELLDLGSAERLAEGAARLRSHRPDAVVWACTSGSFVYGWEGALDQVADLAEAARAPASSTSFAFVNAARAVGATRVAVAASYPDDVATRFASFLATADIEVLELTSHGIDTAAEVGVLSAAQVTELVLRNDHPDADAVLVPDTAMRTFGLVPDLESQLGKPVLTANQVTIWEGLSLAATAASPAGQAASPAAADAAPAARTWQDAGALFRTPVGVSHHPAGILASPLPGGSE